MTENVTSLAGVSYKIHVPEIQQAILVLLYQIEKRDGLFCYIPNS